MDVVEAGYHKNEHQGAETSDQKTTERTIDTSKGRHRSMGVQETVRGRNDGREKRFGIIGWQKKNDRATARDQFKLANRVH